MTSPYKAKTNRVNYEDPHVKDLKLQNQALIEELEFWRHKFSTQDVNEINQLKHYHMENENLRSRFIKLDLKQRASLSSDLVIRDLRERTDELEAQNSKLNDEILKYIGRLKEYEILLAKIKQNDDNLRLFQLNLQQENNQLKQVQHNLKTEQDKDLQLYKAQIVNDHQNQMQKLSTELKSVGEKLQKETQSNEQLKNDLRILKTQLVDSHAQYEIYIDQLQNSVAQFEEQHKQNTNLLNKQQDIQKINNPKAQDQQDLLNKVHFLEKQIIENVNQRNQIIGQNQSYNQQLNQARDQNNLLIKQIHDLSQQMEIMKMANQQEIIKRDFIRNSQLEGIQQIHYQQTGSMQFFQEQIKAELLQKMAECDLNQKTVEKLSAIQHHYESNINQLINEIDLWKKKYQQLDQHRKQELIMKDEQYNTIIDNFKVTLYEQMGSNESKLQNLKNLFEEKSMECCMLLDEKIEMTQKFNNHIHQHQISQQLEQSQMQVVELNSTARVLLSENRLLKQQMVEQEFRRTMDGKDKKTTQI